MAVLGKLQKVDLRDILDTESGHITPWLAQAENIELLSAAIGIDLEVEAQEKNVGPFRADTLPQNNAFVGRHNGLPCFLWRRAHYPSTLPSR